MRLWCLITLPCVCLSAFTNIEIQVLMEIVDYFQPANLLLLDDYKELEIDSNHSFPARHWVLTTILTIPQLMKHLSGSARTLHGGASLVALRQETVAWTELKKVGGENNMRGIKWVLFSQDSFLSATFKDIYIPFDCEFISVNQGGSFPMLTEVYKVTRDGAVHTNHFGYWSPDNGLSSTSTYFYMRRSNFHNEKFTAVIQNSPPYTYVTKAENGTTIFGGYFYEVWKELEHRLKFRTEFVDLGSSDRKIINLLASGEYPFAVSPITQDPKAAEIIGLSEPIYEAKVFLFGNRPGSELEWNSYLKPFSSETWLVTLGWMLGTSIALSALYRVAWNHNVCEPEADYYIFTFPIAFSTVFRAMCAQGSDVTPRSNSCRLLFLSIYLTALVVTSAFSAALFSLLTIPVSKPPFAGYQDVFSTSKGYKVGIISNSDIHQGIKDIAERFPNSDHSKLLQMIEPTALLPAKVKSALERVCMQKNYIFMWDLPNVLEELQELNRTCQEKVMPGGPKVFSEHMGFGMRKNNPWKEIIDLHLVQLKNEGVLRRLLLNTWPPHIPDVANTWVRVTLADISPILYMFAMGIAAGCIILMLERLRWSLRDGTHVVTAKASQLMGSLRLPKSPMSPISPYSHGDHWTTRYTDWGNKANLHRRQVDKLHDY